MQGGGLLVLFTALLDIGQGKDGKAPALSALPPLPPLPALDLPTRSNRVPGTDRKGVAQGLAFFTNKPIRPILTRMERFMERNKEFQREISELGQLPNKGANMVAVANSNRSALSHLQDEGSKGIVLQIENYSGRHLTDPRIWNRCGYQHSRLGVFEDLPPATIDLAVLHNNKELRSSCGSISWQVMEHRAKPYKTVDGKGLRLYMTWSNLDTIGRNRCKNGKPNEFSAGFHKVDLDASGHWEEGSKKTFYKTYHKKEHMGQNNFQLDHSLIKNVSGTSLVSIEQSPDSQLEIRVEMGTGCLTDLTIQILGRRAAKIAESDLGLAEAKKPDEVWEQMIRQSCMDIVNTINRDRAIYGVGLEPMYVDPLMKDPIFVNTSMLGYEIEFFMWNITVAGLPDLKLEKLELVRGDSLKNLDTKAILDIGNLSVTGMYRYKAVYTGWVWGMGDMDSEGDQPFAVDMTGAKFEVDISLDAIDGCNKTGDVVFTKIGFPIKYETVNFDFTNIGAVLGGAIGVIGEMALELSKGTIVDVVKTQLRAEVNTLLCDGRKNSSALERIPFVVSPSSDASLHKVLSVETKGWGINTLRRDILAEQFVKKIFNDGVARHLANPQDPIVKALDPFQMLPVNEDFRSPGLVKGHVVVCEFWLMGLSKLHLIDMKLARNEDLTYSALKVKIGIPNISINGKYRLNNVRVMSAIPAPKSEGTMDIALTGITVDLLVTLRTKPVRNQGNATIAMELFEVEFGKDTVSFNITGLAKGMNTITNKVSNKLGNKILDMQKKMLNQEIKNILFGVADCLMYKPGMGMEKCMDKFWESLGFEVPFTFPACEELYSIADKKLGIITK